LTLDQIAEGWFEDSVADAEEKLEPLIEAKLVERHSVFAHPLVDIFPPTFHWKLGDETPSDSKFAELSAGFISRWKEDDEAFEVYVASRSGVAAVGGYAYDPPDTEQWTHDIHVGQILVALLREMTETASYDEAMESIIGEAGLPKLGKDIKWTKDPDMFVIDPERGEALQILEFAGSYDEKHLKDFHKHCAGEAHKKLKRLYPKRKNFLYGSPAGTQYFLL